MAEAILGGILKANVTQPENVYTYPRRAERRKHLESTYEINCVPSNAEVVMKSEIIFLSVKPNQMSDILKEIGPFLTERHLLISIAAGFNIDSISNSLEEYYSEEGSSEEHPFQIRTIRTMPNLPALVGDGATPYTLNQAAKESLEDN